MEASVNALNWFDIPVNDYDRAQNFYESIFNMKMMVMDMDGMKTVAFPVDPTTGKVSGGLTKDENNQPSMNGVMVYLNANPSLDTVVGRVEAAGGKVLMDRVELPGGHGFMAVITDTEGNKIGLHANA